ncbi:MAG TPA: hypothetical protein DGG94_20405 [Micromonosporaceae bacterium]|nr:hypothetical protein [Micromonosporaceae bacterium]HCU52127.1 hypothetical protein [Micromonosporaceae bacterium]
MMLIIAPLLILAGVLLRLPFDFFFPAQLAAYRDHPALLTTCYSLFLLGNVLMWPAVAALSRKIASPWGVWGGALAMFGLFARTFHAGVDHLAFQLARVQGVEAATDAVAESYGAFHVMSTFSAAIMFGWIVLAIGAYRAKVLGLVGSVALGLMATMPLGVLKGTTWFSVLAAAGLCIALVPLGIRTLREGPRPSWKTVAIVTLTAVAMFILGRFG